MESFANFIWVSTLCLLLHENVFSKQCYLPTENLNRSHHHFLPVSGNTWVSLRRAFQDRIHDQPPRSPPPQRSRTPADCNAGDTRHSPGEAAAQKVPRHVLWDQGPQLRQGPGRPGRGGRPTSHPPLGTLSSSCLLW